MTRDSSMREFQELMRGPWADRDVTPAQVARQLGSIESTAIGQLSRMVREEPEKWRRLRRGVYRFYSQGAPESPEIGQPPAPATDLLLSVLTKQPDGKIIAQDIETMKLYVVQELSV